MNNQDPFVSAIDLFGNLILTFIGFAVPVVAITLSFFQEGMSKLTSQYENAKTQSEENLRQMASKEPQQGFDLAKFEESLKTLKKIKRDAEWKIRLLNPKIQLILLFLPLIASFIFVLWTRANSTNISIQGYIFSTRFIFLTISILSFIFSLVILWNIFVTIIEVIKIVNKDKRDVEQKTIELLSGIFEKVDKNSGFFLKKVFVVLNDATIDNNDVSIPLDKNVKIEIAVGIMNKEVRMAKNVEIGLTLPPDFIIEKSNKYTIYTDKTTQVVRYSEDLIQGKTGLNLTSLTLTALNTGKYSIKIFVKGENIEVVYYITEFKVS
jgi:ABC-type multidrug transport system fused ATPase/permease subunit